MRPPTNPGFYQGNPGGPENPAVLEARQKIQTGEYARDDPDANMPAVNNVTRFLDSHKVSYTVLETPTAKLGALQVAQLLSVPPDVVFKTIVVTRDVSKKPVLAVVPGPYTVSLKALAAFLGEKKVYLASEREAEQLTGLQAGGISPLALINKGFQVVIDSAAQNQSEIHVSGGQRGMNIRLPVADLVKLTNARVASICQKTGSF